MIYVCISLFFLTTLYIVYRLNLYIISLEEKVKKDIEITQNLFQSLKNLVDEGLIQPDGKIKKLTIQKEKNFIINGTNVDNSVEF